MDKTEAQSGKRELDRYAIAWNKWRGSQDGRQCSDLMTLGPTKDQQQARLEYRLWRAWKAGTKLAEESSTDNEYLAALEARVKRLEDRQQNPARNKTKSIGGL